ncbi:phosphonate metabolism protein PhnP [Vibrio rumoiensis]|uniref:Phosphonate metabolism protein PhnP n=1 Tax=Vibrio rumoiensis 1S-45 TaxID=1188252 RepID=A0A1E5E5I5_9VIBR|nr:phosphonate metabolism protein PhnP [Vibrio rumoiensis]OEF28972.1 phosphonate metabolism protein PhnP [Vibrio rumoiensis 1S-45]
MKFTLLGSGNTGMLPVYGCDCIACQRASEQPQYRRQKTSALIEHNGKQLLLDANCDDLLQRFPSGSIDRILLTHYHMDHVHGLFDLRWGVGERIAVDGPPDEQGCDDLFKHSGLLDFQPPLMAFQTFEWQGIQITPLPMQHSKICFGYCFTYPVQNSSQSQKQQKRLAYLTDTVGLPADTQAWLAQYDIDVLLVDCNHSPKYLALTNHKAKKNHNDLNDVLDIVAAIKPKQTRLIHISHELECWAMRHPEAFNTEYKLGYDGEVFD